MAILPNNGSELATIRAFIHTQEERNKIAASFHKVVLHVHSPESHDYLPLSETPHDEDKKRAWTFEQLHEYGVEHDFWENNFQINDDLNGEIFSSPEEHISFLLLIAKLIKKNVEGFILTDHNTFDGYSKAAAAAFEYKILCEQSISIIRGIEISCADSIHVIGIFDEVSCATKFQEWLNQNLVSVESGVFQTSYAVLEKITELQGIAYPAHLNTAPLFGKDNAYSGAYKKKLLTLPDVKVFGIKTQDSINKLTARLRQVESTFNSQPVLEDDSHSIPTAGENYVWLKCKKINSQAIRNAFRNPKTQMNNSPQTPQVPKDKIVSLFVDGHGFLGTGKPELIRFSNSMTSLIGGRGVGKSTILKCLHFLTTGTVTSASDLAHILEQGTLCAHVIKDSTDYYIYCGNSEEKNRNIIDLDAPPVQNYETNNEYLVEEYEDIERKSAWMNPRRVQQQEWKLLQRRLQIFKNDLDYKNEISEPGQMKTIFKDLNVQSFQSDALIAAAKPKRVSSFIRETIGQTKEYRLKINSRAIKQDLTPVVIGKEIEYVKKFFLRRSRLIQPLIDSFNKKESGKLKIKFSQTNDLGTDFNEITWLKLLGFDDIGKYNLNNSFGDWRISRSDVLDLVIFLTSENGLLQSVSILLTGDEAKVLGFLNRISSSYEGSYKWSEKRNVVDNVYDFVKNVGDLIKQNKNALEDYLNECLRNIDHYELDFNIVNTTYGENRNKPVYHSVDHLSMGQTIVAMLSFVLSMSSLVGVSNSILLDQPEDNLDSQYIYHNLVKDLLLLKEKRQVILATHNSTIVVNSGSELVVSMKSENGVHGWIAQEGYTAEPKILREIVNVMEGGMEATKNKIALYTTL
ncbi:Spaf_1101 family AAA-like ATPase [Levilactobacillus brevis]|uniref:Spaf_1101 family AAA-like ATPase n=1 Tax=Levilactobacillus brevis TaxID=1580 RepID=UPI000847DA45|nr:AAA family ATPase [Levilactobacillus brevis]ODP92849.1 hypothetical protein BGC39_01230 [Levilactobacillus brevis]